MGPKLEDFRCDYCALKHIYFLEFAAAGPRTSPVKPVKPVHLLTEMISIGRIAPYFRPHGTPDRFLMSVAALSKLSPSVPDNVRAWFQAGPTLQVIPPVVVREWLGEIVRSHYRVLYSIAFGYLRSHTVAEDLVQNSVMKALQGLNKLKDPESVVGWLAAITRNNCLQELRRRKSKREDGFEPTANLEASPSFDENRADKQRILLEAVNCLPETQALVVRLRFLEDCDIDDIALRLGIRKNTVEVRLHRAVAALARNRNLQVLRSVCP